MELIKAIWEYLILGCLLRMLMLCNLITMVRRTVLLGRVYSNSLLFIFWIGRGGLLRGIWRRLRCGILVIRENLFLTFRLTRISNRMFINFFRLRCWKIGLVLLLPEVELLLAIMATLFKLWIRELVKMCNTSWISVSRLKWGGWEVRRREPTHSTHIYEFMVMTSMKKQVNWQSQPQVVSSYFLKDKQAE